MRSGLGPGELTRAGMRQHHRPRATTKSPRSFLASSLPRAEARPRRAGSANFSGWAELRRIRRHDAALARFLGTVQRVVGSLEERNRIVFGAQLRNARRQEHLARLAERPRRDGVLDPAVQLVGLVDPRLRNYHRELVASHAARDVRRADDVANALRGLGQDCVPGQMADAVVDVLEVVEVEDDQGELALVAVGTGALPREGLVEEAPVVEAREGIQVGELACLAKAARVLDRRPRAQRERLEPADVLVGVGVALRAREDRQVAERLILTR